MKMRTKAIVLLIAALLLTTVMVLPRIIEAKRLNAASGAPPYCQRGPLPVVSCPSPYYFGL